MNSLHKILCGLVLIIPWAVVSCSSLVQQRFINRWEEQESYDKLLAYYLRRIHRESLDSAESLSLHFQAGECFRKMNQIEKAVPHYEYVFQREKGNAYACLYLSQGWLAQKRYQEAQEIISKCQISAHLPKLIVQRIQDSQDNLRSIPDILAQKNYFKVKNLQALNTAQDEYAPVYRENFLYFSSNRKNKGQHHGRPLSDLYQVPIQGALPEKSKLKSLPFNKKDVHEGNLSLTEHGNLLIFSRGNTGKAGHEGQVNLYYTRKKRGKWGEVKKLNISREDAWDSTPFISADGKTLYFASNRPGGYGGTDLYVAKIGRRGFYYRSVKNLGPHINTPGNEVFPCVGPTGNFYFASDGHPGLGKLDLFQIRYTENQKKVENLGRPINSQGDDFGIFFYDSYKGFFSSNRPGGKGGDDIYTFINKDPDLKIIQMSLDVLISSISPKYKSKDMEGTRVRLLNNQGLELDQGYADVRGISKFQVFPKKDYLIQAEKLDFFTQTISFSTRAHTPKLTPESPRITRIKLDTTLLMTPIAV
ncbi:MAG: hypothetical protein OXB93_02990, partial [Cytophagales bacterium]|nr:hypothetical protein [Cytophagales bacterium]